MFTSSISPALAGPSSHPVKKAPVRQPVFAGDQAREPQGFPDRFDAKRPYTEDQDPLAFLGEPEPNRLAGLQKFVKQMKVLALTGRLFFEDAVKFDLGAAYYFASVMTREINLKLAKGDLKDALEIGRQWAAEEAFERDKKSYVYEELARICKELGADQRIARAATREELKELGKVQDQDLMIPDSLNPAPIHVKTARYYEALQASEVDFGTLSENLYQHAIYQIDKALEEKRTISYIRMLCLYREQGKIDQAIEMSEKLLSGRKGENFGSMLQLAELYEEGGRTDQAIGIYQHVTERYPQHTMYHFKLSKLFLQKGDLDKAVLYAREASVRQPDGRVDGPEEQGKTYTEYLHYLLGLQASGELPPKV